MEPAPLGHVLCYPCSMSAPDPVGSASLELEKIRNFRPRWATEELAESQNVRLEQLEEVGETDYAGAYVPLVKWNGKTYVFLESDPNELWSRPGTFTTKSASSLANIGYEEATTLLPKLWERAASNQLSQQLGAAFEISNAEILFHESQAMRDLKYQNRQIAKKVVARVRNRDGIVIGLLKTPTPGKSILKLIGERRIRPDQIDSATDQIIEQVKILAENGFAHRDLAADNIRVSIYSGKLSPRTMRPVTARLTGFHASSGPRPSQEVELASAIQSLEKIRLQPKKRIRKSLPRRPEFVKRLST